MGCKLVYNRSTGEVLVKHLLNDLPLHVTPRKKKHNSFDENCHQNKKTVSLTSKILQNVSIDTPLFGEPVIRTS